MSRYAHLLDDDDDNSNTDGNRSYAVGITVGDDRPAGTYNTATGSNIAATQSDGLGAQLQFQDFVLSDTARDFAHGEQPFGSPKRNQQQQQQQQQEGSSSENTAAPGFWSIEHYACYFNVNTHDVTMRMLAAVVPLRNFTQIIGDNPDLYGPFWISTTVILCLWVTSSLASSLTALMAGDDYSFDDITLLSFALSTVYAFVIVVPLIIWGVLKYFKAPGHLLHLFDVYGYGLCVWIPVSILCIIPSEIVRWIIVAVATGISIVFSLKAVGPLASEADDKRCSTIVYAITFCCHGALAILFKFGFFKYVYKV